MKDMEPNPRTKAMVKAMDMGVAAHKVEIAVIASFSETNIHLENALLMASSVKNVMVKTILAKCAVLEPDPRVVAMTKVRINISLDLKTGLRIETSIKKHQMILMMVSLMTMMRQNFKNMIMLKYYSIMML